jgi:hypothetical protein
MKTYRGAEVQLHHFRPRNHTEGECLATRPRRFIPEEIAPSTHMIGGWVGPLTLWRRGKSWPAGNLTRAVQPVARQCTDWAIPAPIREIYKIPGWRYLLGNNGLSHSVFHSLYFFPTSPSVLHHCRARTLELANPRTVDSRSLELSTLEPSNYRLSISRSLLS